VNQRARELRARILKLVLQNAPPNYAQLMQLWRQWRYEVTR
jgi:hypothetical protein